MTTKAQLAHLEDAKEQLRKILNPGDTVLCNLKHVSRSGMYRCISLYVVKDNQLRCIDYLAAGLLEGYDSRHYGCKAGGCGMDMGFHLVYNLSSQLFRNNFYCIGEGCPANDHSNRPYPERIKDSMLHSDAGYALNYKWM